MNKRIPALARRAESKILILRGMKVILDSDLAELYGVEVRQLNQQVRRNARRFPFEFLFQLSEREFKHLRSQNVISSDGHGGRRYLPYAFTEFGAIMAATVLNSERAIEMSVFVVRAFVRMRQSLVANRQVISKLAELEQRVDAHDSDIQELIEALREMMTPPAANRRAIGFETPDKNQKLSPPRSSRRLSG
jgi:phage regulator Rha-like protein